MLHIYGRPLETGANEQHDEAERQRSTASSATRPQQAAQSGVANQLALPLHLPKNRSTGNLALAAPPQDRSHLRFSFDASAAAAEFDAAISRSPLMTEHDHGFGLSGLRRIRQYAPPGRAPTLPSAPAKRSSSFGLPRSVSMVAVPQSSHALPTFPDGSAAPAFTEDLTRFPTESLHSFSFAHQSGDWLSNQQNVPNRSLDYIKERASFSASFNAGFSAANARSPLVGYGNWPAAPLTGPPDVSGNNIFEGSFIPRTTSPEAVPESLAGSVSDIGSPLLMAKRPAAQPKEARARSMAEPQLSLTISSDNDAPALGSLDSVESSRTPTNESRTTQKTSPPLSRRPSLLLRRTQTDVTPVAVQQRLLDSLSMPPPTSPPTRPGAGFISPRLSSVASSVDGQSDATTIPPLSATAPSFASPISASGSLSSAPHVHPTRWVPAAQAIFTTEAKPPWTIIAANDLACLVFGVTRAEVRKMGILEVVQEERRAWLEKKLLHPDSDGTEEATEPKIVQPIPTPAASVPSSILGSRGGGITAKLLSKPSSRAQTPKASSIGGPRSPQQPTLRTKSIHSSNDPNSPKLSIGGHHHNKSRGVLLCGDVVPIQKRNGLTGSASLWVKEKRVGLIWVLEEIHEDIATVTLDDDGCVTAVSGTPGPIWGEEEQPLNMDIGKLVPRIPRHGIDPRTGPVDFAEVSRHKYYTCRNYDGINIPTTLEQVRGQSALRVSSFPHIAGIIVISTQTLAIKSSNSVFCGALFGHEKPNGLPIIQLIPDFDKILDVLIQVDNIHMAEGVVVPEHTFRKASAFMAMREGYPDAASDFLRPNGIPARHRDGANIRIDVQMRVLKSSKPTKIPEESVFDASEDGDSRSSSFSLASTSPRPASAFSIASVAQTEMVYALWITYSRHLHASRNNQGVVSPLLSGSATPLHQPSPGQTPIHSPYETAGSVSSDEQDKTEKASTAQLLTRQLKAAAMSAASKISTSLPRSSAPTTPSMPLSPVDGHGPGQGSMSQALSLMSLGSTGNRAAAASGAVTMPAVKVTRAMPARGHSQSIDTAVISSTKSGAASVRSPPRKAAPAVGQTADTALIDTANATSAAAPHKRSIDDFAILEEMGQGAYGQVKLAEEKKTGHRVVIKYVTKKRILVDTWTRDRRLGTVPLEIHVLDYLRRNGLQHRNIVEMEEFFEDDVNYYIEMKPHGMPGMDLFDYIELRTNMEEEECRNIFVQVVQAIHHLHTKALVVHRDVKDENVVLDGEGNIKLIDFGSAAYIKSGPFDVFVGTIDYAAPEVLAGRPYKGKEQDVWALGILLYTIIYKENPFYSIDEIMDRDLRIPYTISDDSIDLIQHMLDRDVSKRYTIDQVLEHPWFATE